MPGFYQHTDKQYCMYALTSMLVIICVEHHQSWGPFGLLKNSNRNFYAQVAASSKGTLRRQTNRQFANLPRHEECRSLQEASAHNGECATRDGTDPSRAGARAKHCGSQGSYRQISRQSHHNTQKLLSGQKLAKDRRYRSRPLRASVFHTCNVSLDSLQLYERPA